MKTLILRSGVSIVSSFIFCLFFQSCRSRLTVSVWTHTTLILGVEYFPCLSFLRWKGPRVREELSIADIHAQVQIDSCVLFFYVRAGSPPTGQSLRGTPDTFTLFNFIFYFFCCRNEVKMGMLTKHFVVNFLFYYLYFISYMDMCISLSKQIIKHPFATCPGHHSCRVLSDIHPMVVILADKLILHANQSLALVRTFICTV